MATDLPEVDRRGRLVFEADPVVLCLCMLAGERNDGRDELD